MKKRSAKIQLREKVAKESPQISEEPFPWKVILFISIMTALFYLPVLHNRFVNWDDAGTIIENQHLFSWDYSNFKWMFTSFHTGNWIPLTWLSFSLDYAIGGLNPVVYHVHNLLLHTINTLLVFFLSLRILQLAKIQNGNLQLVAGITALLFGLHPIHVESVAWASERKDLLCCLFYFSSILVYLAEEKRGKLPLCFVLFFLALLSKPMAVSLPLVLLLLDIWPLRTVLAKAKIPFFALSLAFSLLAINAQASEGAISDESKLPLDFRIMNGFHSLMFYLWKMAIPLDLVPFYPLTSNAFSLWHLMTFVLVCLISFCCYYYRKEKPYLAIAWLFYVITLTPVLGFIQVGGQAAADRYTYIPSLSIFLLVSSTIVFFFSHRQPVLIGLSLIVIGSLGFATMKQIELWNNSVTLWESVVKLYPNQSIVIHTNLGNAYKEKKQYDQALGEYNRALALGTHGNIYDGKGAALLALNRVDDSIVAFNQAITLNPTNASYRRNLWFAYDKKGMHEKALEVILEAVQVEPEYAEAYNNLGISYGRLGQFEESIQAFKTGISLNPNNCKCLVNLATSLQRRGQLDEAINWYKQGIQLNAKESIYLLNLANTYLLKQMFQEAIDTLHAAANIDPACPEVFQKLANIYEKLGQKELATQNYIKADAAKKMTQETYDK